jgi:cysteine desulfuration protein SufE
MAGPVTPIDADLAEMAEEFDLLGDWEERYRHVIDLGRTLSPLTDAERSDANKVRGCASQVWLVSELVDGSLRFRGDSDAHIVRGLVAIVLATYSGKTASEIVSLDAFETFSKIGLVENLSAQRSNGLRSMVNRIREEARVRAAA